MIKNLKQEKKLVFKTTSRLAIKNLAQPRVKINIMNEWILPNS